MARHWVLHWAMGVGGTIVVAEASSVTGEFGDVVDKV